MWTGDSARHDNDEQIPRSKEQVLRLNEFTVEKFAEIWAHDQTKHDHSKDRIYDIPIVPTWGNNDILPHNIFTPGPNLWTHHFLRLWDAFIPEAQRHTFAQGGWFSVEVIPNKLAVFSLNTLYFYTSNSAVDGCANPSEPGFAQMEWLRVQLAMLRKRGMKALLTGHVPPARTDSKMSWEESCWQKYALWVKQYRDVLIGSMYGHMNIDHFVLQDSDDIDLTALIGENRVKVDMENNDGMSVMGAQDYLSDLREGWSRLPEVPHKMRTEQPGQYVAERTKKKKHRKEERYNRQIGGPWAERFSLSLISPSIVPNYFPSLRIVHYNISGLETSPSWSSQDVDQHVSTSQEYDEIEEDLVSIEDVFGTVIPQKLVSNLSVHRKHLKIPKGPSRSSPPGPAYSPQPLSLTGITQFSANLTWLNHDFDSSSSSNRLIPPVTLVVTDQLIPAKWKEGKHGDRAPPSTSPSPRPFAFQVLYDTRNDSIFALPDLTIRSFVELATRIGRYKPRGGDRIGHSNDAGRDVNTIDARLAEEGADLEALDGVPEVKREDLDAAFDETSSKKHKKHKNKKKKKHRKQRERKAINRVWFAFVRRAFVGAVDDAELHERFGRAVDDDVTNAGSDGPRP